MHEGEVFSQLLRKLVGSGQCCGQIYDDRARPRRHRLICSRLLRLVRLDAHRLGRSSSMVLFGPSRRHLPVVILRAGDDSLQHGWWVLVSIAALLAFLLLKEHLLL